MHPAELPPDIKYAVAFQMNLGESNQYFPNLYYVPPFHYSKQRVRNYSARATRVLRGESLKELWAVLSSKSSYGDAVAACFYPRHAVVFFNAEKEIILVVNICFECNNFQEEDRNGNYSNVFQRNGDFNPKAKQRMKSLVAAR